MGLPSPASSTEPVLGSYGDASVAGIRAEGASTTWLTMRAASVVGSRHRLAGEPSDDFFAWSQGDGWAALAVADGLGAIPGSADAAARTCSAAVLAASSCVLDGSGLDAPALAAAARLCMQAAESAARGGGATTLVLALVAAKGTVSLARVGDSTAFVVDAQSTRELFPGREDGTVGTSTAALPLGENRTDELGADARTAEGNVWETASWQLQPGEVLVLATDGVADPWRDGPQTVDPALRAAITGQPSPLSLAGLVDFSRQGCHDDRTVMCAWLRTG
ncbi:MAG: protein phosphatase 2C domain-containing protein [Acidimicrobiales bacterium]